MRVKFLFVVLFVFILVSACGGGGGGENNTAATNLTNTSAVLETSVDTVIGAEVDLAVQDFAAYVAQAPQEWQNVLG